MYTHVLVPLDGSRLAEAVLPAAASVAKMLSASVTLVHVIEKNPPREIHGEAHLCEPGEAEAYLREVAGHAFPADLKISYHVHTAEVENVAASIAQHIGELGTDLVVMCSHGRGGMRDLLFGNIAQQVIALGKTPVLLIQPNRDKTVPLFHCQRILVPLDGQSEHELGLVKTKAISKACGAVFHLLIVVPTMETLPGKLAAGRRMMPGATSEMLDMEVQEAEEYLLKLQGELEQSGFTVTVEVLRGDAASLIVEIAQGFQADLIVLGTHARCGMDAFWAGSIAPKISRQSKIPLLFVPVE